MSSLLRAAGLTIGFGSLLAWFLTGHPPEAGAMTFAAGLVVYPNVAEAQRDRNVHRERRR